MAHYFLSSAQPTDSFVDQKPTPVDIISPNFLEPFKLESPSNPSAPIRRDGRTRQSPHSEVNDSLNERDKECRRYNRNLGGRGGH